MIDSVSKNSLEELRLKQSFFIQEESLVSGYTSQWGDNVYLLPFFPESYYKLSPDEAVICLGTGGELALAICMESEEAYTIFRCDLRNPGARIHAYIPKDREGATSLYLDVKKKSIQGLTSWTDEYGFQEGLLFPVGISNNTIGDIVDQVYKMLLSNELTRSCLESSVLSTKDGVDTLLELTGNSVSTILRLEESE